MTQTQPKQMKWKLSLTHPGGAEFGLEFKGSSSDLESLKRGLPPILDNASQVMMTHTAQEHQLTLPPNTINPTYIQQYPTYQQPQNYFPVTNPTVPFTQAQLQSPDTQLQDYSYIPAPTEPEFSCQSQYPTQEAPTVLQSKNPLSYLLLKLRGLGGKKVKEKLSGNPLKLAAEAAFWIALVFVLSANPTTRNFLNGIPVVNSIVGATDGINPIRKFYQQPQAPAPVAPQPQPTQPPQGRPPQGMPPQGQPQPRR